MNSKKFGSKVKGFTLIEMLVVIAIIAVLAGILSILTHGFQRDARLERNNNYARMVFTGFQNILIQSEISQDDSMFVHDSGLGDIKGVCVYFHVAKAGNGATYERNRLGNKVQLIVVPKSGYDPSKCQVIYSESGAENPGNGTSVDDNGKMYNKWKDAILGNIDESFEGTVAVYIDYENYEVDSVAYRELEGGKDPTIGQDKLNEYYDGTHYRFYGLDNMQEAKDIVKDHGIYFGVYPYREDLS